MANLKLIKVTGSPFSCQFWNCIGIQTGDTIFEIIHSGDLNAQTSSTGNGWRYATAEEIAENWKLIYPHWTPEPGDNVIVTQDYDDWTNCRCTILEKDRDDTTYYRVKKESGRMSTFNYTTQMILAPTTSSIPDTSTTITETKSESSIGWKWQDLKVGDKVKIIGGDFSSRPVGSIFTIKLMEDKDYLGKQPIRLIDSDGEDKGWPHINHFEPYYGDVKKPKEETVTVRFLTEQEFKDKDLWRETRPKGWNYEGKMNRYLGEVIEIPKSRIESNGSFRYENWKFEATDYIVTGEIPISISTSKSVVTPIPKPEKPPRRFKIGDKVTYKSRGDSYHYGGDDQGGFVGTVEYDSEYVEDKGCYCLRVTTKDGDFCYNMLESEFHEYDSGYVPITSGAVGSSQPTSRLVIKGSSAAADGNHIFVGGVAYPISHYSSDGSTHSTIASIDSDPLSSYEQKPIIIKQKPKTKLTII